MPTNPTGDNTTKTISLEPELYAATLRRWGKGTQYRTFSAYVAHLIRDDLRESRYGEHVPQEFGQAAERGDSEKGADVKTRKPGVPRSPAEQKKKAENMRRKFPPSKPEGER